MASRKKLSDPLNELFDYQKPIVKQTAKHSDSQTAKHSDSQTAKHSDSQTAIGKGDSSIAKSKDKSKKKATFYLDKNLLMDLKIVTVKKGCDQSDIIEKLLQSFIKKQRI